MTTQKKTITIPAQLNIICDSLAKKARENMKQHLNIDTTIPQTRATLFINNTQITNKLHRCIQNQLYDKPFQQYLQQKNPGPKKYLTK